MSTATTQSVPLDSLAIGRPQRLEPSVGDPICLLRTSADEVIAFVDRCPHRDHPLSEGSCVDGNLRCALHGWEFSIPGGEAVSPRAPFGLELVEVRTTPEGNVEVTV